MPAENGTGPQAMVPANDNGGLANAEARPEPTAAARVDRVVLDIVRLIGGQLAREAFEARLAANDNRPAGREGEGRGPDGKPSRNKKEDLPP